MDCYPLLMLMADRLGMFGRAFQGTFYLFLPLVDDSTIISIRN